jgi:hypothetical protein
VPAAVSWEEEHRHVESEELEESCKSIQRKGGFGEGFQLEECSSAFRCVAESKATGRL